MTALPSISHRTALLRTVPPGELLIHEIYRSLQGESTFAGLPCVFVRLTVCDSRCSWCFVPDTPVLMADWSWKAIGELNPGDSVLGTERTGAMGEHQTLAVATVLNRIEREAATVRVNNELTSTPEHKFWLTGKDREGHSVAHNGWREVTRCVGMKTTFLTEPRPTLEPSYERGWLAGMADGDGCFWTLKYRTGYRRFRLALRNPTLLNRFATFAERAGYRLREGVHSHTGFTGPNRMSCLWLTASRECQRFETWLSEDEDRDDWRNGYIGGMIDAEGSLSQRVLRIAQNRAANPRTWDRIHRTLLRLGWKFTIEPNGFYLHRSKGRLWSILAATRPAKWSVNRAARESNPRWQRVIESVVPTGKTEPVTTLQTTSGNYFAAGYLVKNCDTPHAFAQGKRFSRAAVLEQALSYNCPLVELTGGEPLLQPDVFPLMTELCDAGKTVLLETSGAHDVGPVDPRVHIIADLKCPDSGECERNFWPNLEKLKPTDEIKFVIASRRDWDWAAETVRTHGLDQRFSVLVSAVFGRVTPRELAEWVLESGLNVRMQLQMHKYIWDPAARGV